MTPLQGVSTDVCVPGQKALIPDPDVGAGPTSGDGGSGEEMKGKVERRPVGRLFNARLFQEPEELRGSRLSPRQLMATARRTSTLSSSRRRPMKRYLSVQTRMNRNKKQNESVCGLVLWVGN